MLSITKNARDDCDTHEYASSVDDVLALAEFADHLVVNAGSSPAGVYDPCSIVPYTHVSSNSTCDLPLDSSYIHQTNA
jgi:hypothetical protein